MSKQTWREALKTSSVSGTNYTASTTATSLLAGTDAKFTLPANFFEVGKVIKITACGQVGNVVTTPGTLTLDIRLGAVIAFNMGAINQSTTVHTTLPFWLEVLMTCRTVGTGTAATCIGQGRMTAQAISNTQVADADTTTIKTLLLPNTTPAVGTGFDSTIANTVDLFATYSLNNADAILITQFALEALN